MICAVIVPHYQTTSDPAASLVWPQMLVGQPCDCCCGPASACHAPCDGDRTIDVYATITNSGLMDLCSHLMPVYNMEPLKKATQIGR